MERWGRVGLLYISQNLGGWMESSALRSVTEYVTSINH